MEPENERSRLLTLEGTRDDQLVFPGAALAAPEPVSRVVKRDGREVPFETRKIAEGIRKAARASHDVFCLEDPGLADSLASAVSLYLARQVEGRSAPVEQVQDTVEKVLVEMGHPRAAVAYARYADRRQRIRRLGEEDIRQDAVRRLARDAEEPEGESSPFVLSPQPGLFVRTSDERLAGWNRGRIVDALVRETGLERHRAEAIAAEVEEQIAAARVQTLTSSLVRELVDAKLVEHGLEEHRRRHARLGVPLYDAERIICAPNYGLNEGTQSPAMTDVILAERVKKEYALTQVFSSEVSDAHLSGDLHVHDLGFVDRFRSATHVLEDVKLLGIPQGPAPRRRSGLAHDPETLLAQAAQFNTLLQSYCSHSMRWEAFDVLFAPFIEGLDASALGRLAQLVLFAFGQRASKAPAPEARTELVLYGGAPAFLRDLEAVGRGGMGTGSTYGDYGPAAQRFAEALLGPYADGYEGCASGPRLCVCLTEELLDASGPGNGAFWGVLAQASASPGNVRIEFQRGALSCEDSEDLRARQTSVMQMVSLNLPRAAFRARRDAPLAPERGLFVELERLLDLAAQAHQQKREFVERLVSLKDLGPLGLLADRHGDRRYLELDETGCGDAGAHCLVGVVGLNECVQALTGTQVHESEAALALARKIAAHVKDLCGEWGRRDHLRLVPAHANEEPVAARFASLDLHAYPEYARDVVKADPVTQDLRYTPGGRLAAASMTASADPHEQLQIEGELHALIPTGAVAEVRLSDEATSASADSLADLIRNAFHRTTIQGISFCRWKG